MSASRALWKWHRIDTRPATAADDSLITRADRSIAHDAGLGQQQIGQRRRACRKGRADVYRNDAFHDACEPHDSPRNRLAHRCAVRLHVEPALERECPLFQQHREAVGGNVTAFTSRRTTLRGM